MMPSGAQIFCAAVLFDLDGVLVSSGGAVERSWRQWAARNGIPAADVLAACHGRTSAATVAALAPRLDPAAEAARLEAAQALDTAELAEVPGAADLLAALPAHLWAVVTSGGRHLATARLRAAGLPVPEVLVTADDVREGKPSPEGYRAAAAALGVPSRLCVVVEDARPGVLAARAAGCRVLGVDGGHLGPPSDVDLVVRDLTEVAAVTRGRAVGLTVRSTSHV